MVEIQSKTSQKWPSFVHNLLKDTPSILDLLTSIRNVGVMDIIINSSDEFVRFGFDRRLVNRCKEIGFTTINECIWVIYVENHKITFWAKRSNKLEICYKDQGKSVDLRSYDIRVRKTEIEKCLSELLNILLEYKVKNEFEHLLQTTREGRN